MNKKKYLFIKNFNDLENFAKQILPFLSKKSFLLISGDLGVGKTTFVQFLCAEFGISEKVTSPTFTILKRYWIDKKNCFLNHFDFFRVDNDIDIESFDSIKNEGVNIVEWPERVPFFSNENQVIKIKISFYQSGRKIEFLANHKKILKTFNFG